MKHPSKNYIKYLIIEDKNVNEVLASFDLPLVKDITQLELNIPDDLNTTDPTHKASIDWLKKEKIHDLYYPDLATKEAISYLEMAGIKESIQNLLIARLPAIEIARKLNGKWQINATSDGVDKYRHYFWDTAKIRFKDWAELYREPSERTRIKKLSNLGAQYALQTEGFVQQIETKEALREIQLICYRAVKELSMDSPSPDWVKSIAMLTQTMTKINDALSEGGENNREVLKRFEHLSIQVEKTQIKNIKELTSEGSTITGMLPAVSTTANYSKFIENTAKKDIIDIMS